MGDVTTAGWRGAQVHKREVTSAFGEQGQSKKMGLWEKAKESTGQAKKETQA